MTSDPLAHQRATPAPELPEAIEAQIQETREVLRADAEAAGVDPQLVDQAVDAAAASYVGSAGSRLHRHPRRARGPSEAPVDDAQRQGERNNGTRK